MPGWYIHMDVARKSVAGLAGNATAAPIFSSNGPTAADLTKIGKFNPTYVALGAIGPDIFFLLPDFKPPVGNMRSRTHLALAKDSPVPRSVQSPSTGLILATPEVGGLHHRYDRVAA